MDITTFGLVEDKALEQMQNCLKTADRGALMADNHLGYSVPIGGVVAYKNAISPNGVGFDIACGNKAVKLDCKYEDIKDSIPKIMDDIYSQIAFGVGRNNPEKVEHELFEDDLWTQEPYKDLKQLAENQLGTIGSGNHYVDIFKDENDNIWVGVHFGSRGLGHKTATHFLKAGGAKDGIDTPPLVLDVDSDLGASYLEGMHLAGRYAYAGRDWVCSKVASIIGANILEEVHNHHNFAWKETHQGQDYWVVRKGATPAFPEQKGFVGGSMGDISVILKGVDSEKSKEAMYSTVHGAGRVMGRIEAAGKQKWKRVIEGEPKQLVRIREGKISRDMMMDWITPMGIELRGAGCDESPHCYKRIIDVLDAHKGTIEILHTLTPLGVAMAGAGE